MLGMGKVTTAKALSFAGGEMCHYATMRCDCRRVEWSATLAGHHDSHMMNIKMNDASGDNVD